MRLAWALCLLLQATAAAGPGADPGPAAPTVKGADPQLLDEVRRIARNVETLHGESFERPPLALRAPDDVRAAAADSRASHALARARLEARGRAWADLGLGGPDAPAEILRILAADLEGIVFDAPANRLLFATDRLPIEDFVPATPEQERMADLLQLTGVRADEPMVAHLLAHARQRERRGGDVLEPTTDRLLASTAWAEGEANLLAVLYLFRGMNLADVVLEHDLDPAEMLDGRLIPAAVSRASGVERRMLDFVYREGFARAVESYRGGGWPAVIEAARQARTTRSVLHPGSPEPAPIPERDPPAIPGLYRADEDALGEQGIAVLVALSTGKDNLGLLAADGWAGDRLVRWEDGGGEGLTEWTTRWVRREAADDFLYAFARTLVARFPHAVPSAADGLAFVEADGRVYRIERADREVRIRIAPAAWDARLEPARATPGS